MKEVVFVAGAGQISLAITRRIGYGKKIILGDKSLENASKIKQILMEQDCHQVKKVLKKY